MLVSFWEEAVKLLTGKINTCCNWYLFSYSFGNFPRIFQFPLPRALERLIFAQLLIANVHFRGHFTFYVWHRRLHHLHVSHNQESIRSIRRLIFLNYCFSFPFSKIDFSAVSRLTTPVRTMLIIRKLIAFKHFGHHPPYVSCVVVKIMNVRRI